MILFNKKIENRLQTKLKASKTGLFLSRFQPIHNGHLYVIEKMCEECDEVYICIGSSNKCKSLRNPLPIKEREMFVRKALEERGLNIEKVHVIQLPDWSMESKTDENKLWGKYLYFNVVSEMQKKYFTIYYSDNPKYIEKWFKSEIKKYVFIKSLKRDNIANGISATKIREALLNENYEYVKENCPKCVYDYRESLHVRLKLIADNPKDDYSM